MSPKSRCWLTWLLVRILLSCRWSSSCCVLSWWRVRASLSCLFLYRLVQNWLWFYSVELPEKAMAPHSSTLAWKISQVEKPGRLQSMGSRRVRHDWATSLSLFTFMHWRRKWQPAPGFLPGESQRWGSLVGCRIWGHTESDTTEASQQQQQQCWTWPFDTGMHPSCVYVIYCNAHFLLYLFIFFC